VAPTVIPLPTIADVPSRARSKPAAAGRGCSGGTCGGADARTLPPEVARRIAEHPCYSEDAHRYFARMHVPVAFACNIQCNYCNRKYDCANESRPGVTSARLTPEEAANKALAVAAEMPELAVVGIAGPGDALADSARTFETCRRLRQVLPDVTLCLSTNGLALPDHVETIGALGINHVTVTVNAIDAEVAERIYAWIFFRNRRIHGIEAARILIDRQLDGIARLAAAGVLVKINSVLIPGINDDHLGDVHQAVRARGAFLHNIVPLISDPAHGTVFGQTGQRGPTPSELAEVQERLGPDARLMRHCRQCRADAVGMLNEDRSASLAVDHGQPPAALDPEPRQAYRQVVAAERRDQAAEGGSAARLLASFGPDEPVQIAVCSRGGGRINQHFGHSRELQVFAADRSGVRFIGIRRTDAYCRGGDGDDQALERTIAALDGISVVLCAKVGVCPKGEMEAAGITLSDAYAFAYIETGIARYFADRAADHGQAAISA
jgi:nitrogen fixation protein NifB